MADYIFGANILENLTTGMYKSAQMIFREYIQNACDAIDKAVSLNILNVGEGEVNIWIEEDNRYISVEDNGVGISAQDFERTLQSIAQSNKRLEVEKGFRGIGRLCGLAYCRELIFSTTAQGENIISVMRIDAQKLRSRFYGKKKYTAQEVLDEIITVEKNFNGVASEHWFKVELVDIINENETLLDVKKIREYLSFIAPVEYQNYFCFSSKIYEHAAQLNFKIDEYKIFLNEAQLVKGFKTNFTTSQGEDEIFDVSFHDFYDSKENLIAWGWIGLSKFKGIIAEGTLMRSIRLRKGNIQIGHADTLQELFKESRGIHYFIGEIFAVYKDLIPNSQRDYFIENPSRQQFENSLRVYFEELHKVYHRASEVNSAIKKIQTYERDNESFQSLIFISKNHRIDEEKKLEETKEKAAKSTLKIKQRYQEALLCPEEISSKVVIRIAEKNTIKKSDTTPIQANNIDNPFPNLNKKERKLVFKILDVIRENTDTANFEKLQDKIVKAVVNK